MKKIAFAALVLLALYAGGAWAHQMHLSCAVGGCDIDHTSHSHPLDGSVRMYEPQYGFYPESMDPQQGLGERVTKLELEMQGVMAWIYRVPEPIEYERSKQGE